MLIYTEKRHILAAGTSSNPALLLDNSFLSQYGPLVLVSGEVDQHPTCRETHVWVLRVQQGHHKVVDWATKHTSQKHVEKPFRHRDTFCRTKTNWRVIITDCHFPCPFKNPALLSFNAVLRWNMKVWDCVSAAPVRYRGNVRSSRVVSVCWSEACPCWTFHTGTTL